MRLGERVKSDEYAKESAADFALWKARVPEDGVVYWPSPFGDGRPGWHIECSAMSMKILGTSFDLHLGGEDLVFPHHEDEIAQSEGCDCQKAGQKFVKYWMHGAHLLVEGKKMSKSEGNYFTLRSLMEKGFSGREVRYLLLSAHYRESFNFTIEGLNGAKSALARLDDCITRLRELANGEEAPVKVNEFTTSFEAALDNDLNISSAWAVVFDWIRSINRQMAEQTLTREQAAQALGMWKRVDAVLAIGPAENPGASVPKEIEELMEARQQARKSKDFKKADVIRDELKAKGWVIEDTPKGPRAKRIA
jgi:cysteinyl-tRNA synthetase